MVSGCDLGKPVDNNGTYVDYLKQDKKNNCHGLWISLILKAKERAVIQSIRLYTNGGKGSPILKSGRNKAAHRQASSDPGSVFRSWNPPFGDGKYGNNEKAVRKSLALCACHLKFKHPATGKIMDFQIKPDTGAFKLFSKSND